MPTGLVLSGGGSRGAFQVGAARYLYAMGVRPDIITGTSVGAINGAKLAEGEGTESEGLRGLLRFWLELRENSDMWVEQPWLDRIHPQFKRALTFHGAPEFSRPWQMAPEWGDISALVNGASSFKWLLFDGGALLKAIEALVKELTANSSLYNLSPIAHRPEASPDRAPSSSGPDGRGR